MCFFFQIWALREGSFPQGVWQQSDINLCDTFSDSSATLRNTLRHFCDTLFPEPLPGKPLHGGSDCGGLEPVFSRIVHQCFRLEDSPWISPLLAGNHSQLHSQTPRHHLAWRFVKRAPKQKAPSTRDHFGFAFLYAAFLSSSPF